MTNKLPLRSRQFRQRSQVGSVTLSGTSIAPGGSVSVAVTFSPAFALTPSIQATVTGWPSSTTYFVARVTGRSLTGCIIHAVNVGTATVSFTGLPVDWSATATV